MPNVFAAGDITSHLVKQGGIAAQQADAVAEVIAAEAGAAILPEPFRPVLRSVLLTGNGPRYLSSRLGSAGEISSVATTQPFWSPADKIAAPFLAPYLARRIEGALR
jgi:sulfide:quinone oxidoreductase